MNIIHQALGKTGNKLARLTKRSQQQALFSKRRVLRQQQQSKSTPRSISIDYTTLFLIASVFALIVAIVLLFYTLHHVGEKTHSKAKIGIAEIQKSPSYPPLMGIMMLSNGEARAIFENHMLKIGDLLAGDKITHILPDRVKVDHQGRTMTLLVSSKNS